MSDLSRGENTDPTGSGEKKRYDNLPTLIGVSALGIIAVLCVAALWRLSEPPATPLTQSAGQAQTAEQTQLAGETQPADEEPPADATQPATEPASETPAQTTADTVADSTASATTLGLVAQIVTAIGGIAPAAVGGIAGLLIPRGGQGSGGS